ncbi:MAG: hypothetical protein AAF432_08430 [Planctomycetota bacterium]
MAQKQDHSRIAWLDQFNEPDAKELRKSIPAEEQRLFDDARKKLLAFDGVEEVPTWYGDCWHWVLEYRVPKLDAPLGVIIPSPEDLQLAIPMTAEFSQQVPLGRMKRAVRDGFDLGREPYDTEWAIWSLVPGSLLGDLIDLVKQKIKHLGAAKS